jgi:hypothetical protein
MFLISVLGVAVRDGIKSEDVRDDFETENVVQEIRHQRK